jgi:hypothetical protein
VRRALELVDAPAGLFLALQAGWWAAVGGAASGRPLLGAAATASILAVQLWATAAENRRGALRLALGLAIVGTLLDSLLVAVGVVRFAGSAHGTAPIWITVLWAQFALALPALARIESLRGVRMALLGAAGGPLAYWGGVRLGAAALPAGTAPGLLSLAVEWGLVLPLAVRAESVWRKRT